MSPGALVETSSGYDCKPDPFVLEVEVSDVSRDVVFRLSTCKDTANADKQMPESKTPMPI